MSDEERVVVITGASGGIGAALARELARAGHSLALAARRGDALAAVAAEVEALGAPKVIAVKTDVTKRAQVLRLRDVTIERLGRIDVWVNNAGRGITRRVLDLSDEDVDEMIAVNVKSALYGMQAAMPHFMARGTGHLINVSSMLGRVPLATFRSAYSAAKAALNSLTANLRMDLRATHPGIRVSLVMPGVVTTDFARNVRGEPRPPLTAGAPGQGAVPPRVQTPEEVAESIARLIERPEPELYTNPDSAALVRVYQGDIPAFEARMVEGSR